MDRPDELAGQAAPAEPLSLFQIQVNGQLVVGEIVFRSRRDIQVRIVSPFINISFTRHIPTFAPSVISYLGEHGDETARDLLRSCYELGHYLDRHLARVREAWARHLDAASALVPPAYYGRDAFLARRKDLRSSLKQAQMTPAQYQTELSQLKKAHLDFDNAQHHAVRTFLGEHFPSRLENDADLAEKVIPILEGRVALRPGPPS